MASELSEAKQRARDTWDAGDFPAVARLITSAGELAADRAKLTGDEDVLDVACGSGNATLPAARSGARVTGLDLTPSLLEAGKRDAEAEAGLEIEWVEGDAEQLPLDEASFDAVLSVFGVMFAPDHRRLPAEIARVLRPGGRMVLSNWTPEGARGRFFKVIGCTCRRRPRASSRRRCGGPRTTSGRCSRARESSRLRRRRGDWKFDSVDEVSDISSTSSGR